VKPIKQVLGDKRCVACVSAMATDTTVEEFEAFMQELQSVYSFINTEAPYGDIEMNLYLMRYGLKLGDTKYPNSDGFPDSKPASVTVKSENYPGINHAIYWNGKQIFDPSPKSENGRPFSDYKVVEWCNIVSI